MDLSVIIAPFITLFAIMDPFASLPVFFSSTKGCTGMEASRLASKAVMIAAAIAAIFLIAGPPLLAVLSITLSDFKVAGGIVLVLLGLENALNISFSQEKKKKADLDTAAVLIGTPLLTGPGLMASLIVLSGEYSAIVVVGALVAALILSWLVLVKATDIRRIFGERVVTVTTKVIGLILIAMGIAFIRGGLL
jgi:multiple antibiotic resistance protein